MSSQQKSTPAKMFKEESEFEQKENKKQLPTITHSSYFIENVTDSHITQEQKGAGCLERNTSIPHARPFQELPQNPLEATPSVKKKTLTPYQEEMHTDEILKETNAVESFQGEFPRPGHKRSKTSPKV